MIVEKSITIQKPIDVAFKVFTDEIGSWWPLKEGFSFGGDRANEMYLEGKVGGRLYERFTDGEEYVTGTVTAYDPPSRVVFTWTQPEWEGPTEVEVRFSEEGHGTRVELVHRGWENIGPEGEKMAGEYQGGWDLVLGKYAAA
jgi:uncharacterized protein YndB with AHSA1/START domain